MSHVKMGMRNAFIVGMRRQNTVVRMLSAVRMPEKPASTSPAIQRSPPRPGEWTGSDSGDGRTSRTLRLPPAVAKPETRVMPPR
jgi:hypothetical protein